MKITVEVTESELKEMNLDSGDLEYSIVDAVDESDVMSGFNVYIVIVDEVVI